VHGFCGIWGTLSLGIFACGKYGAPGPSGADTSSVVTGLFYGGGTQQLVAQAIGSAAVTGATFGVSLAMMYGLKSAGILRVSKEGELEGLDLHEHGGTASPELIGAVGKMETPTVAKGENVPIPVPALVD
jgi:Amt family ammonium transporter